MRQELIRINSTDGIEQPGILYTPDKDTAKIVIHIHGLNGNFYENRFLDTLATTYTDKGYAFLTFNNRGRDFISELSKDNGSILIGGGLERFKDCILDIDGVVKWAKENGYKEIALEGHSYGCNKALYYYVHKKDSGIVKIILLAPCDIPAEVKKFLSEEEYIKAREESTKLIQESKETELIDFPIMANGKIAAGTYFNDFLPNGENDFIRYSDGATGTSKILSDIDIPTLIIFGDIDECVLTQPIDIVKTYLKNNLNDCDIQIIPGADHSYTDKYEELGNVIKNNF